MKGYIEICLGKLTLYPAKLTIIYESRIKAFRHIQPFSEISQKMDLSWNSEEATKIRDKPREERTYVC